MMVEMNTQLSSDIRDIWSMAWATPPPSAVGLTQARYIKLQEEYIKDEQRLVVAGKLCCRTCADGARNAEV